mgnify:CR=1 FL=1
MSQIINDVESLKKFRNDLCNTSEDLLDQLKKTDSSIESVAEKWKDSQFQKFHEGFKDDKDLIQPLCKQINEFENDVLYPLEKILRKYLEL